MAHKPHKETGIFINEVSSHQHRYHKVLELTHSTTKAAGVMLLGAIVALVVANTAAHGGFAEFWHTEVSFGFGSAHAEMSLATSSMMCLWPFSSCWSGWKSSTK